MRRLFPLLVMYILVGSTVPAFAQDTADFSSAAGFIFNTNAYRKGIYKSFKEFQLNSPSEHGNMVVKNRSTAAQIYLLASRNELHIADSTGKEKKVKDYWGFSDGKNVYIKDNGLNKLQEIGYYCLYEIHAVAPTPVANPNAITFNNTPPPNRKKKVINIITGQVYDLTLYNLRKYILPPDRQLLEMFNTDAQKRGRMEYYIHWFNERNTPVL
ncbi:hypothetical protein [uncultured Chitinophaga sp.]|jgi:hypothetical protein|uniref:hypothetical protein n=1 Tax=uncultured Chitinophaga sp. TaxID=339340 RepID=UPI002619722E|nr:hypothetical protein [uncultured Chitinophaga sp.]